MNKLIIVPNFVPLYAMRKCFGPTKGPLQKPTTVPVDIIGELLLQKGKETVKMYEVTKEGKGYSEPVLLTLENYKLPYEVILTGSTDVTTAAPVAPAAPVEEVAAPVEEVAAPVEEVAAPELPDDPAAFVMEDGSDMIIADEAPDAAPAEDTTSDESVLVDAVAEDAPVDYASVIDGWASMSNKQRNRAKAEYNKSAV